MKKKNKLFIYREKEVHIVQVGGIILEPTKSVWSIYQVVDFVTYSGVHFHLYTTCNEYTVKKLKELEKQNKYFHYEGTLPHEQLIMEITKYDFGSYLTSNTHKDEKNDIMIFSATGNKMFDYLMARLPILCFDNMLAVIQFNEQYGVGITIKREQKKDLKKILCKIMGD